MNFRIQQHQERFQGFEDFRILSFTVDPEHDTVEVLKNYARRMNAQEGRWFFFTGERDELYTTASHYLLSAQADSMADGGFLHSEQIVLVDWNGRIRSRKDDNGNVVGSYNALIETEMRDLTEDIKVLIAEFEKEKSRREYEASKKQQGL
jgi:protein SCO1/2